MCTRRVALSLPQEELGARYLMRWSRQGLLLSAPIGLDWAVSHAALPVPVPLGGDRIRLFFSARDDRGRSQIGRAELDLGLPGREPEIAPEPVIGLGPLGAFDDSGITASCVVEHGGRWYQYYSGWQLGVTVPFLFFVGLAVSDDGVTFEKVSPAPILERNAIDPYLTASPWVIVEDGLWRMWYVSGTGWQLGEDGPKHQYHLKYAESADGITWHREGRVAIDYRDESEYAISRPCVIKDADCYRMWFSVRGDLYRIGYAESADGLAWERLDGQEGLDGSSGEWDSAMQAYPAVLDHAGRRIMLYNGNGYGATGIGFAEALPEQRLRSEALPRLR